VPQALRSILDAYVQAHYSRDAVDAEAFATAVQGWRTLRWRLRLLRFWERSPRLSVYLPNDADLMYRAEGDFLVPHDS
jgi:hypothetical protein